MSFDTRAKIWESGKDGNRRIKTATTIAEAIQKHHHLSKEMEIVDFGVGTGLLGFEIAKKVKKVYGIDTSEKMLEQIKEKNSPTLSIEPLHKDLTQEQCTLKVDGIISSMTLHHIKDIHNLFKTFYDMLQKDGFIALADLVKEDGSFHSDNSGVHHFGFEKEFLFDILHDIGFRDLDFQIIYTIQKPHKDFDLFLLSAKK